MTANENLTLTADDLSRATLARQLLVERVRLTPAQALARLLAIQAQWPKPAFFALFARLAGFQRDDLMRLVRKNAIVRGTSFRGTIFLQLAKDFARFRGAVLPTLERAVVSMVSKKIAASDYDAIVARGRAFFAAEPRTFDELRTAFGAETKESTLVVEPFSALTKKAKVAIEEEGEALICFAGPEASKHDLRFDKPRS